ncbi:hypothetical protein V8E36_006583 [Tilletia maclaganii]
MSPQPHSPEHRFPDESSPLLPATDDRNASTGSKKESPTWRHLFLPETTRIMVLGALCTASLNSLSGYQAITNRNFVCAWYYSALDPQDPAQQGPHPCRQPQIETTLAKFQATVEARRQAPAAPAQISTDFAPPPPLRSSVAAQDRVPTSATFDFHHSRATQPNPAATIAARSAPPLKDCDIILGDLNVRLGPLLETPPGARPLGRYHVLALWMTCAGFSRPASLLGVVRLVALGSPAAGPTSVEPDPGLRRIHVPLRLTIAEAAVTSPLDETTRQEIVDAADATLHEAILAAGFSSLGQYNVSVARGACLS